MFETANRIPLRDFAFRLRRLAAAALLAAALVGIFGAFARRALYADGAHFLLKMIETGEMTFPEAPRRTIHRLQQWPADFLLQTGTVDFDTLSIAYGLTVFLLPILLTAACYLLLPRARRAWMFFPLVNYLAGSLAAGFPGIVEGPVATGYFWLLLYAVAFLPETVPWQLTTIAFAIPAMHTHEVFGFLAPLLAVAAAARARRAKSSWGANLYYIMMMWFVMVGAVQVRFVLAPVVPSARTSFFDDLIDLVWLVGRDGGINVPALLGLWAVATMALGAFATCPAAPALRTQRVAGFLLWATAGLAIMTAAVPWISDRALGVGAQFAARNHPALMAVPLAVLAWASIRHPGIRRYWIQPRHLTVLAFLAFGTLGWQAAATVRWAQFTADFRTVLQENRGLVPWTAARNSLPEPRRELWRVFSWPWTNPTLSIMLAPGRRIRTLIANPEPVIWQPFDPTDPQSLPRSDLFDTSDYLNASAPRPD